MVSAIPVAAPWTILYSTVEIRKRCLQSHEMYAFHLTEDVKVISAARFFEPC